MVYAGDDGLQSAVSELMDQAGKTECQELEDEFRMELEAVVSTASTVAVQQDSVIINVADSVSRKAVNTTWYVRADADPSTDVVFCDFNESDTKA